MTAKPKAKASKKRASKATAATKARATKKTSASKKKSATTKARKASSPAKPTTKSTGNATKRTRKATSTSAFGVGRREGHDATGFYERFTPPNISDDAYVNRPAATDTIWVGDARSMDKSGKIADASVALVVTSPPYFAGKAYEQDLGENGVPASYLEYLDMLEGVFAECVRKLEPGGRIAVNVANLGRKPYRSLSADVINIFERLGLLLRGEVIWRKAETPGGSCAWGSFQRPANPVLRDTTERIIIASKGRFDRALAPADRHAQDLPAFGSILADEFLDATSDVWDISPESARRVGHPAPFPTDLPQRLIELYTYVGDLVLDPFMGAGSTAIAAIETGRHYVGFDTDAEYVELTRERIAEATAKLAEPGAGLPHPPTRVPPNADVAAPKCEPSDTDDGKALPLFVTDAIGAGQKACDIAASALREAGFVDIETKVRLAGTQVSYRATDQLGNPWLFEMSGTFSAIRPGQTRTDLLWKSLTKALIVASTIDKPNLVLLTTHSAKPSSPGGKAIQGALATGVISATLELLNPDDLRRLAAIAERGPDAVEVAHGG